MKHILLFLLLSLMLFYCKNSTRDNVNSKILSNENIEKVQNDSTFLQQFRTISLPYSNDNLKTVLLKNNGRDTFDEKLFEKLKIRPLKNYNILRQNRTYYPVGKIVSAKYWNCYFYLDKLKGLV